MELATAGLYLASPGCYRAIKVHKFAAGNVIYFKAATRMFFQGGPRPVTFELTADGVTWGTAD
jgi:hypothetical protein